MFCKTPGQVDSQILTENVNLAVYLTTTLLAISE